MTSRNKHILIAMQAAAEAKVDQMDDCKYAYPI